MTVAQPAQQFLFSEAEGPWQECRVEANHTALVELDGRVTLIPSSESPELVERYVRSMNEARSWHEGIRQLDLADEDFVVRQTYRNGGTAGGDYEFAKGALHLRPGQWNTIGAYRLQKEGVMTVGSIWAVDSEVKVTGKAQSFHSLVVANQPFQPGPDTPRHERDGAEGLRLRHEVSEGRSGVFHIVPDDSAEDIIEHVTSEAEGEITMIIHRVSREQFSFYVGIRDAGKLVSIGQRSHPGLAAEDELYLGLEAHGKPDTKVSANFKSLRELRALEDWSLRR